MVVMMGNEFLIYVINGLCSCWGVMNGFWGYRD